MYTKKTKYIWILDLVVFIVVVFMGIEQAGTGAEISNLENKIEKLNIQKRDLAEKIFENNNNDDTNNESLSLGFVKPSKIYYFDSEEAALTLK